MDTAFYLPSEPVIPLQTEWTDDQLNELMSSLSDNEAIFSTSDSTTSPVPIPEASLDDSSYAVASSINAPVLLNDNWAPR